MNPAGPRGATAEDIRPLTRLWHDGWRDAHAAILPGEVAAQRTLDNFGERLKLGLQNLRVIGPVGDPDGFSYIRQDELYQFYVHRRARGTGAAALLMSATERQFADAGTGLAWLACAIGNDRAARFYEKMGWRRVAVATIILELRNGDYPLDVWRYEKRCGSTPPAILTR